MPPSSSLQLQLHRTAAWAYLAADTDRLSDELMKNVRARIGDTAFDDAWEQGTATGWIEAANFAISHRPQVTQIVEPLSISVDPFSQYGLTVRERNILDRLSEGKSNQEISDQLSISIRTAGTHVANIYGKLGCTNRAAAVSIALRAKDRSRKT